MPRRSLVRYFTKLTGDAALELLGEATQWDDMRCPAASAGPGASNPTFTQFRNDGLGSIGVYAQRFADPGAENDLMFDVQWSHKIKEGTVAVPSIVYPHIHWSPNDAVAGNVGWGLEYTEASIGMVFPATQLVLTAFATGGVQYLHQLSGWAGLSSTTRKISAMLKARVYRSNAGAIDTYAAVTWLHEFDVHFEIDTIGSKTPTVK